MSSKQVEKRVNGECRRGRKQGRPCCDNIFNSNDQNPFLHIMLIPSIVSKTDLGCRLEILGLDLAASQSDDDLRGQVRAQGSHCRAKTIQIQIRYLD